MVCHVDGNPPPTEFFWQFNSTTDFRDVSPSDVIVDGSVSVATYVPRSEADYGTLLCWGKNPLGRQRRPCVFHVIPAGTYYIRTYIVKIRRAMQLMTSASDGWRATYSFFLLPRPDRQASTFLGGQ